MRFLIVGLGSMGKRRIRNLRHLNVDAIAGFDPRADRRTEASSKYAIDVYADVDEAVEKFKPDAFIISTPPDLHSQYAMKAIRSGRHFFAEASVVEDGFEDLITLAKANPALVAAPSCTLRYHPSVKKIKELVEQNEIGNPLFFTYHAGQWLPDWHPWEDYREFYVSKRETGGAREIVPFELCWLTWVLGSVERVTGMKRKLSSLNADIDDTYQAVLDFESGALGHLLVDVVARAPVRFFRMCSEEATVEWEATRHEVRVFTAATQQWVDFPEPAPIQEPGYTFTTENHYIDEMRDFVAACEGEKPWGYSLEEDLANLKLLSAIETSSATGAVIDVSEFAYRA